MLRVENIINVLEPLSCLSMRFRENNMKITTFGESNENLEKSVLKKIGEYAERLGLKQPELYLVFAKDQNDIRKYYEKFSIVQPENLGKTDSHVYEAIIKEPIAGGFLPKCMRKEGIPPVVLINTKSLEGIIGDRTILDELTHEKDDELGWYDIEMEALSATHKGFCFSTWDDYILQQTRHSISNYLSDEIGCKYGYSDLIFQDKKEDLSAVTKASDDPEIKNRFSEKSIYPINIALHIGFMSVLPSSYSGNKDSDEKHLDEIVSPILKCFPKPIKYNEIKSAVHGIAVPPRKENIELCYAKIFGIYNSFLDSIFDGIEIG